MPKADRPGPDAPESRSPRKRDREVLDAAAKVFAEKGYSSSSVQDVADEVGILKGSLYHYIDSKDDLLHRLLDGVHDEVEAILREVESEELDDPLDRLQLYVSRQVSHSIENLERISIYYHDIQRLSPERRESLYSRRRVHQAFVSDLIKEAQSRGEVDPDLDPNQAMNSVFGTIIWVYRWYRPSIKMSAAAIGEFCGRFAISGVRGEAPQ